MTKLSLEQVTSITTLLNNGKSTREVAKIVGYGKSTVANYRRVTAIKAPDPKVGRPQKLTSRDKRVIARSMVNGGVKTAVEMARLMNTEREDKISPVTIRRALKEEGLKAFKKKKKQLLSKAHRRARLKWALDHKNWTIDDWKRVIWSDETKLNQVGSDGIKYFWGRSSNDLGPAAVEETLKFGGGNIMIWGCMSWFGVGEMDRIVGRMNSEQFLGILESCLVPTLDQVASQLPSVTRTDIIFQQNNDPKHTSRMTKEWLASRGIKTMVWPSQSRDLNPIEHLWGLIKRRLGGYQEAPKGVHELRTRAQEIWHRLDGETYQTLI
ncbi:hypothetical protein K3495_g8364 [Podosphaera aphanis]|nr:hypothetical protein K3495_g8364 [Podosphaera aphanis]